MSISQKSYIRQYAKGTKNENGPQQLLESVLAHLKGVKQGRRGYTACCPSHNDSHPSLEVWTDETDGHVGIVCYAGCTREQIVQSIGLQESDLYLARDTKYRSKKRPVIDLLDLAVDKLIPTAFLINLGCLETKKGIKIPYRDTNGKEYPRARFRTLSQSNRWLKMERWRRAIDPLRSGSIRGRA